MPKSVPWIFLQTGDAVYARPRKLALSEGPIEQFIFATSDEYCAMSWSQVGGLQRRREGRCGDQSLGSRTSHGVTDVMGCASRAPSPPTPTWQRTWCRPC